MEATELVEVESAELLGVVLSEDSSLEGLAEGLRGGLGAVFGGSPFPTYTRWRECVILVLTERETLPTLTLTCTVHASTITHSYLSPHTTTTSTTTQCQQ